MTLQDEQLKKTLKNLAIQTIKVKDESERLKAQTLKLKSLLDNEEVSFYFNDETNLVEIAIIKKGWRSSIESVLGNYPVSVESTVNSKGEESLRFIYYFNL